MIRWGDKVKVKDTYYQNYTNGSPYNLPRTVGTIVAGSTECGYIIVDYGDRVSPPVNPENFELVKEATQMFEVGKKYKSKYSGIVYDCIWIKGNEVLLRNPSVSISHELAVYGTRQDSFAGYVEYVEPKVVAMELLIRTDETGDFWATRPERASERYTTLGRIRVTHTEGQGIKVEVIG